MTRITPVKTSSTDRTPVPGADPGGRTLRTGLQKRLLSSDARVGYYLHVSSRLRPGSPIMVAVHGIRRRADRQALLFAAFIEAAGGILVAPEFGPRHFSGYQRLGRHGRGGRADLTLKRILAEVEAYTGCPRQPIVMFGYSGGGQFVHRYAMANPRLVSRLAIAAPGWFTFPDIARRFPEGVARSADLPDLMFDPARFLQIPSLLLVGEHDVDRDAALNKRKSVDKRQGMNRMERGKRWIAAMKEAAARYGYATPYRFETVTGCGHSFDQCMTKGNMGPTVVDFLLEKEDTRRDVICGIHSYQAGICKARGGIG